MLPLITMSTADLYKLVEGSCDICPERFTCVLQGASPVRVCEYMRQIDYEISERLGEELLADLRMVWNDPAP